MHRCITIALLLFWVGFAPNSSAQNPAFIHPNPGTQLGEVLTNVIELRDGSFVFCGGQSYRVNDTFHSDAVLIKTNARGAVISKKIFPRPANTTQDFPFEILPHRGNILLLSAQDTLKQSPNIIGKNRLSWRLLDTALNTISEKVITLTPSYFDMLSLSALQIADTTFVTCVLNSTYGQGTQTALFTLDAVGNLIAFKFTDGTFFGYPNFASIETIRSIEPKLAGTQLLGSAVVSCKGTLNQPIIGGYENFLIGIDAQLNVVDTLDMSRPLMPAPTDTFIGFGNWEVLPLANGNYIVGGYFGYGFGSSNTGELPGLGLYNATTRKYQKWQLADSQNYLGLGIQSVLGRSLVQAGSKYYLFGNSGSRGYLNPENSWVLIRFNEALNGFRTLSFSEPGFEYTATHIKALTNGGAMLLGSRNAVVQGNSYPQRDYYAIRLDSAGNVLSVPDVFAGNPAALRFQIAPNPGTGQFLITDTKGKLQEALVYDLRGRLVRRQEAQGSSTTIIITGQPAGVYLLQIRTTDGAVEWKRVMLQ